MTKMTIITGGTSGVGLAIAEDLVSVSEGLLLVYRQNDAQAQNAVSKLKSIQPSCKVVLCKADLSEDSGLNIFFQELETLCLQNQVTGFVSAHGRLRSELFLNKKIELILQTVNEHLISNIKIVHKLIPHMAVHKLGRFLFITSLAAHKINRGQVDYALSKAALETFAKSLTAEFFQRNLTFNCLSLGLAENNLSKEKYINTDLRDLKELVPLKQVAQLAKFLLAEATTHISGATYKIDGGLEHRHNNLQLHESKS